MPRSTFFFVCRGGGGGRVVFRAVFFHSDAQLLPSARDNKTPQTYSVLFSDGAVLASRFGPIR